MKRIFVIVMPLFLALLFFNIDISAVSASGTALSNTQKEKIIEHIKNHDASDMSDVSSSFPAGTKACTVNWMVYWSELDSQYYLLYFPVIDYVANEGTNKVRIQCSAFLEPYSCYCFYYHFDAGELKHCLTQGHCNASYDASSRKLSVFRLASADDIVACSIPLYDKDGLNLFDTEKNPEGLEPPDSGGDSGGGGSGGDAGDTGEDSSGVLGFLKEIGEALSSIVDFFATFLDAIRLMLCDLFIPQGGFGSFITEAFNDYLDVFSTHFSMTSYSNLLEWLESAEGYNPQEYFGADTSFSGAAKHQHFDLIDLSIWRDRKPRGWGDKNGIETVRQILRIFFYPLLVFGDWKFLIWLIRGSSSLGSGKEG